VADGLSGYTASATPLASSGHAHPALLSGCSCATSLFFLQASLLVLYRNDMYLKENQSTALFSLEIPNKLAFIYYSFIFNPFFFKP